MKTKAILIYFSLFLIYVIFLPTTGFELDMHCWKEWTKFIFNNGLANAYKSGTDYMPIMQYFMFAFGEIQGSIQNIEKNINYIKTIALTFDFIGGIFLLKIINEKIISSRRQFYFSLFYFLNIAVFYNTLFWGQVDGILSTLVFISVFFAYKKKELLSIAFFILAINFKLQAIVFLPLIGLLILPEIVKNFNFRNFLIGTLTITSLQFLILSPFILSGDAKILLHVTEESFKKYPVVSMNSAGIWNWFVKGDLSHTPDSQLFLGISLKVWGLIMFFSISFFALLPLLRNTIYKLVAKSFNEFTLEKILIIGALIPMLFCFLNTEMHERYLHPALIFALTFSIITKNFWASGLICLAYLLNLEHAIQVLQLRTYGTLPFSRIFLAALYFLSILLLFKDLYGIKLKNTR